MKDIPASSDTLKDYVLSFHQFKTDFLLSPGRFGQRLILARRKTAYVLGKPLDSGKDLGLGFSSPLKRIRLSWVSSKSSDMTALVVCKRSSVATYIC